MWGFTFFSASLRPSIWAQSTTALFFFHKIDSNPIIPSQLNCVIWGKLQKSIKAGSMAMRKFM